MIETLQNIDSQLLLFFNGYHTPFLDHFMMLFTGKFIWIPMYAAILPILFKKFRPGMAALLILGIVAAIALADQTCASLLRPYFHRLRPANLENPLSAFVTVVDGYRGGAYGFPSCHAANSLALATFLCLVVRRNFFVAFIFTWAAVNCYSRMYLGVHYPGDILVGGVIGAACGALCYYAVVYVARRFFKTALEPREENFSLSVLPSGISGAGDGTLNFLVSDLMIAVGILSALFMMLAAVVL
ncbi:MAG: phosphatase PAP2 family protein [Muribaculaceae bacterium]|nr:phosphatase PAP2 family protein [Muribaculaceae bacterium]